MPVVTTRPKSSMVVRVALVLRVALVVVVLLLLLVLLLVELGVRVVVLRCRSSFMQGVLQTAAPFQHKGIVGMLVAFTSYCCLPKFVFHGQFGFALPLYVVPIAGPNFAALDNVHIALCLELCITTNAFQLWHSRDSSRIRLLAIVEG